MSSGELRRVVCDDGSVLTELHKGEGFGQLTMFVIPAGAERGGHKHLKKNERWWVLGEATVFLEYPDGTKELRCMTDGGALDVPAGTGHKIKAGEGGAVLVWHSDRVYDPDEPDKEGWEW